MSQNEDERIKLAARLAKVPGLVAAADKFVSQVAAYSNDIEVAVLTAGVLVDFATARLRARRTGDPSGPQAA